MRDLERLAGMAIGLLALAAAVSCNCNSGTPCETGTCPGCCDLNGKCLDGKSNDACGQQSLTCVKCGNGTVCNAAGNCAAATCSGCLDSTGQCVAGNTELACGTAGQTCVACGASEFCINGTCTTINNCKGLGAACTAPAECCSQFCDTSSLQCALPPDGGVDAGADGGADAGAGADAGTDAGLDAGMDAGDGG